MSSTEILLANASAITSSIASLRHRDKTLDENFEKTEREIERLYRERIAALENERRADITRAQTERDNFLRNNIATARGYLTAAENELPAKYRSRLKRSAAQINASEQPDFVKIKDFIIKIGDETFLATFKRLFRLQGYTGRKQMLTELNENIEKGRMFLQQEETKCLASFEQRRKDAEGRFSSAKGETDQKLADFHRQNRQQYEAGQANLMGELKRLPGDQTVTRFVDLHRTVLNEIGAFANWHEYEPAISYPKELMLGAIMTKLDLPPPLYELFKNILQMNARGEIMVPLTVNLWSPLKLFITYSASAKKTVMDGIQSIILRLLKFVPGGIFKITYIDPNDRGSNLGELQKLYSIASSDICKKACASAEDIQKRLKELEKFVDVICAKLAGVDSIYKYNTQNEIPIEQQIVIINDYPANFERRSVETLEMLIKNSDKCGISFIFAVNKDNATDVPEDVREKFLRIEATDARISAYFNRASYSFIFDDAFRDCGVFLEKFKQIADEGVKVDNRFSNFFNLSEPPVYMDSGKSIQIPFALDNRGRLVSLELGGPLTTHALLTGFTNSGKSATLHMLINSIILNYHPDDVELWLVDYKKGEFAFYLKNPPPHIKFIALENSDEFSFSFLDMVDAEFQSRMDFLRKKGFNNIKDYKAAFGARSLPRVVLIIDEFHRLSQAAQSEPKYKQILENILREYRSCGLSCLFCDQTVTGLKGLSDAGLKQIGLRLAMYQQDQKELRETLSVDSSYYDDNLKSKINNLKQGDVIFKREAEGGDGENEQILDKYKCLFIDVNKREHDIVADYARRYLSPDYRARELIAVDGRGRREFGIDVVEKYEKNHPEITAKGIPLYAGTPTTLDSCFCFTLERKPDANILLVGSDDKLRFSILAHLIYSFKRQPDTLAVVLADENDELLHIYENFLSAICDQVVVGAEAICEVLTDYPDYYERKVKDRNAPRPKCLHVLLGLEYLAGEFARFPEFRVRPAAGSAQMIAEPPARSDSNMQSALDDLQAIRLARKARLSGEAPQSEAFVATEERTAPKPETRQEPEPPEAFQTFNCLPVIEKMINDGYRVDTYTLITYSSAKTVRQTRLFKPEKFKHKIALKMSRDDSLEFLGKADYAASLGEKNDEIQAIYYDGGNRPEKFRPYFDPEIGE